MAQLTELRAKSCWQRWRASQYVTVCLLGLFFLSGARLATH